MKIELLISYDIIFSFFKNFIPINFNLVKTCVYYRRCRNNSSNKSSSQVNPTNS